MATSWSVIVCWKHQSSGIVNKVTTYSSQQSHPKNLAHGLECDDIKTDHSISRSTGTFLWRVIAQENQP